MKVTFKSGGGFGNVLNWLKRVSNTDPSVLKNIASYGTTQLSNGTPEDTGDTASGWKHTITKDQSSIEIAWTNDAHPESQVNVAKLIELGHGTGTGGYVPPKPYIEDSMKPVWKRVDNIVKEMMK